MLGTACLLPLAKFVSLIKLRVEPLGIEKSGAENTKVKRGIRLFNFGAPSRTRTGTPLRIQDFESSASTNSTTGALNCLDPGARPGRQISNYSYLVEKSILK